MSEEILINSTPVQTRVALVESGVLQEIYVERSSHKGLVGNIYLGRVMRVLPGMQAAFVDIGLERASFLHASDLVTLDANGVEVRSDETRDIRDLVCEGQSVVVQVVKDPLGSKGARLTTHLSLSSRYLVFMPYTRHVGISQRIEQESERERLRALVESVAAAEGSAAPGGFIVRTASEGVEREGIEGDMRFLVRLWGSLRERIALAKAPALVHEDLPLAMRTLRDLVRPDLEKIRECHVLFVCPSEGPFLRRILPSLRDDGILTVGDVPTFLESGGMVNLLIVEKKVRFEINLAAARREGSA